MDVSIERISEPAPDVVALLEALDRALSGPYLPEQHHALSIDQLFRPNIRFFLARLDGTAVACGGVGFYEGYAELKRMYSKPEVRGRGIAKALLRRLEAETRDAGYHLLRIETGLYQDAALHFYERAGFTRCAAFGPYAEMPMTAIATSVFYEKKL